MSIEKRIKGLKKTRKFFYRTTPIFMLCAILSPAIAAGSLVLPFIIIGLFAFLIGLSLSMRISKISIIQRKIERQHQTQRASDFINKVDDEIDKL